MTDFDELFGPSERALEDGPDGLRVLVLRRRYAAAPEEVWNAITEPDRVARFFQPVSGDLREGGRFQVQDNASGEILTCSKPELLRLTWEFGEMSSLVEFRLTPDGDGARLELRHHQVPDRITMDGRALDPVRNDPATGVWGMGTGWELGFVSLGEYLAGTPMDVTDMDLLVKLADACGERWAAV